MAKKKITAEDGIFGLGKGTVDTDSEEFKILQHKILESSQKRTPEQQVSDRLLEIRFRMEDYLAGDSIDQAVKTVGQFLRECVEAVQIKNKDFASYIGIEESNLSAMFNGRRRISPDFALKLEQIFSIPPALWLGIQTKNELLSIRQHRGVKYHQFDLKDLLAKAG